MAAAALAIVLGAAWAFGWLFTDTARPAAAGSVLARFRTGDPHPRALDGVYRYRTRGGESLDVVGGKRHRYPATTTITVVEVACGVRLRWDALAGRSTTWTLCTGGSSPTLRGVDEVHTFFGQTDRTDYACRPLDGGSRFDCRSQHGGESGSESAAGYAAVVAGAARGAERVAWSFEPGTALPVTLAVSSRTSRSEPLIGRAHYREDATLRLVSTTPER